jgi:hypothetical protein
VARRHHEHPPVRRLSLIFGNRPLLDWGVRQARLLHNRKGQPEPPLATRRSLPFGLNVTACTAPLFLALLSAAAISRETVAMGFMSLGLFGLARSPRRPATR